MQTITLPSGFLNDDVKDGKITQLRLSDASIIARPELSTDVNAISIPSLDKYKKGGLVFFHSPNCHHCTTFMPEYKKLGSKFQKQGWDLGFSSFDCQDVIHNNTILADYLKINKYPTFGLYKDHKIVDYTSGADLKNLLSFICQHMGICQADTKHVVTYDMTNREVTIAPPKSEYINSDEGNLYFTNQEKDPYYWLSMRYDPVKNRLIKKEAEGTMKIKLDELKDELKDNKIDQFISYPYLREKLLETKNKNLVFVVDQDWDGKELVKNNLYCVDGYSKYCENWQNLYGKRLMQIRDVLKNTKETEGRTTGPSPPV